MVLVLLAAVGAAAVGVLRGGSLEALANTRLGWTWLLFAALALQLGFDIWSPEWMSARAGLALVLLTNAVVAGWLLLNRRLPGTILAAIGLLLNVVVLAANGAMPVSESAASVVGLDVSRDEMGIKHELLDDETVLPVLADIIPVPGVNRVVSVGDVVLALGITWLVYSRTMSSRRGRHRMGADVRDRPGPSERADAQQRPPSEGADAATRGTGS